MFMKMGILLSLETFFVHAVWRTGNPSFLSLQAKAVEYTFAVTKVLYSFGFSCVFSPWQIFFWSFGYLVWAQDIPLLYILEKSPCPAFFWVYVMVATATMLCPPAPGNISGIPWQFSLLLKRDSQIAPKRKMTNSVLSWHLFWCLSEQNMTHRVHQGGWDQEVNHAVQIACSAWHQVSLVINL